LIISIHGGADFSSVEGMRSSEKMGLTFKEAICHGQMMGEHLTTCLLLLCVLGSQLQLYI
jgi:hypothetical protein